MRFRREASSNLLIITIISYQTDLYQQRYDNSEEIARGEMNRGNISTRAATNNRPDAICRPRFRAVINKRPRRRPRFLSAFEYATATTFSLSLSPSRGERRRTFLFYSLSLFRSPARLTARAQKRKAPVCARAVQPRLEKRAAASHA